MTGARKATRKGPTETMVRDDTVEREARKIARVLLVYSMRN